MNWLVVSLLVVLSLGLATGQAAGQARCDGEKLTAMGQHADAELECQAKAARTGNPVDAVCQARAEAKFIVSFTKAEAREDCSLIGSRPLLADIGERYHEVFVRTLVPVQDANSCAAAKLKAAGNDAKDKFACLGKALTKGGAFDLACFDKAEDKLLTAFAKAENRPPCLTAADDAGVDSLVNEFLGCALGPTAFDCPSILTAVAIDVAPGSLFGYLPLDAFGSEPTAIGDEELLNFDVPPFVYNNVTFTRIGVSSNGYIVVGGAEGPDSTFVPQALPDPNRPNNVLAPFWTDLDGTGAPGILVANLSDGVSDWTVVEWRVNVFGTTSGRVFQVWIGTNGVQDITFAYDPGNLPVDPSGLPFNVGAENANGTVGGQIVGLPTEDLRVTSTLGL